MRDYYTLAKIACYKVRIWENQREDAIQYIVMKLWEDNLEDYLEFSTLVTYACNKAKDYLRIVNGQGKVPKSGSEVPLMPQHLDRRDTFRKSPEDHYLNRLSVKSMPDYKKHIIEEYIVNGKSCKELAEMYGKSEAWINGKMKDIIEKECFSNGSTRKKTK